MTETKRQEIITALCGYLPYGLKVYFKPSLETGEEGVETTLELIDVGYNVFNTYSVYPESVIPYLRPMSSMTEEEKNELKEYLDAKEVDCNGFGYLEGGTLEEYVSNISYSLCNYVIDWLNEHHFDYRGLIEKGLALEAPEGMYHV